MPDGETSRKPLTVKLTPEALDAWHRFADQNGVTVTALIECLSSTFEDDRYAMWPTVISSARATDVRRRRSRWSLADGS